MDFFIIENGQQVGPFTIAQLAERKITSETLVWKEGMTNWAPAWTVSELRYILEENQGQPLNENGNDQEAVNPGSQVPPVPPTPPTFSNPASSSASNHQTASNEKHPSRWPKILGGVIIVVLLILCLTNPSKETHENAIRTEVSKAIDKSTTGGENDLLTQGFRMMARMMAGSVLDTAMNQLFEYHNYLLFSKGTVTLDGKDHTVSYGILGKVITLNADDMLKALEKDDHMKIEEESSTSTNDDSNLDNNSDESVDSKDENSDEETSGSLEQRMEDKADKAMDKAVDKVSKKVEEKINQKLDEATDSTTIEKLIDKILNLF